MLFLLITIIAINVDEPLLKSYILISHVSIAYAVWTNFVIFFFECLIQVLKYVCY